MSGTVTRCLLDTGSTISILHQSVFDSFTGVKLLKTNTLARTASKDPLPLLGRVIVNFELGGISHRIPFFVSEAIDTPCLLGLDFLQHVPCVIDLRRRLLLVAPRESVRTVSAEMTSVGKMVVGKDFSIPPGSELIIPTHVHNCGYSGPAVAEPTLSHPGVEVVRCIVDVGRSAVPLLVRNVTTEHITIPKHSEVADLEVGFVEQSLPDNEPASLPDNEPASSSSLEGMIDWDGCALSDGQRKAFLAVLKKYEPMFDGHIGFTDAVSHKIETGDHPPIRQTPRRLPPHLRDEVRAQLDELVSQGILEKSDSSWASPICVVKKKNGDHRICADLRKLNSITRLPAYPIARIDDSLEALAGSSLYCTLDMNSAYHQMPIDPADQDKTTITTPFGNFRYTRVCFGLSSAPFTCAKLLDIVLGDLTPKTCVTYFDDIILHGNSFTEVLDGLDAALSRLSSAGLTLNLRKCQFFRKRVTFLGHEVSGDGMATDRVKIKKVREWPVPRTAKQLSGFLGLSSYFRKYVKGFAQISAPLFRLTARDTQFQWTDEAQRAFENLKQSLSEAPLVAFPRFGDDAGAFTLDCDASDEGIGAVLLQEQDGVERVIAFGSHRLSKAQRNYSTTKKELLACVVFTQEFSHYLLGKKFRLRTDHSSLQWLLNFKNPSGMLARWLDILGGFQYDIVYRPGAENVVADALSRRPAEVKDASCQTDTADSCCRVSSDDWSMSFIQVEQKNDQLIADICCHLSSGTRPLKRHVTAEMRPLLRQWDRFRLLEGVLFRVCRTRPHGPEQLQIVAPGSLVPGILTSMHSGPTGGHFSSEKLLAQARLRFWWPTMTADIHRFCAECDKCGSRQSPIPKPRAPMGELHASEPWEIVSIDFLTSLPTTARGNKHLLVCCDHFTRWVEVFPLPDMTATTVARVLTHELFSRFGCPKQLHSDCAANFRGELIAEVCRLMGIRKSSTTSFHPQGNSRCERMMRTVLDMLSKYLDDNHNEWDQHLPLLMLGYRSQVHKSLGYSPFFLMLGREPRLPVDVEIDAARALKSTSVASYVDKLCAGLRSAYREAIRMSHSSNARNKQFYEKKLNTFSFQIGDKVSLFKNVPKRGEYYKFVRPWKPAVIVSIHGELNYTIRLEGTGKILRVHHNRLKPRQCPEQEPENVTSRTGKADGTDPSLGVEGVVDGPVDAGRQRSGRAMQTMTPDSSDSRDSLTLVGPPLPPTDSPQSDPGVGPPRGAGSDPDVTPRDPGVDPGVQTPLSAGGDPDGGTPRDTGVDPNLATSPSTSPDPGVGAPLGGGDPGVMTPPNVNTEPEGAAAVTGGTAAGPRRSTRVRRYPDYFTFSLVLLLWVLARLPL